MTKLNFATNDPAPPFNHKANKKFADVHFLKQILLDNKGMSLFNRYRAIFTLREICTADSCKALCSALLPENFDRCSSLLKHEVAFVLAQMDEVYQVAYPYLLQVCQNEKEASIVKHEALVAVAEMIEDQSVIDSLLKHPDPLVSESCAVALNNIKNRKAEQEYWAWKE